MKTTSNTGIVGIDVDIAEVKFDIMIDDNDDDILIQAEDESWDQVKENGKDPEVDLAGINFDEEMEGAEAADISIGAVSNAPAADYDAGGSGFDMSTGSLWIYPTNYPVRDYQYNIVQQAIYKNTLVVLPTGLGKTFIAAVLMYNFFRWYPQGKIVFMAPTKPLVAQQIQACYSIMGIPKADTVEMTGTMSPTIRQKAWREKRVVFLTPQVMTSDLSRGSVTAQSIKCLVLDEAHKALGNHAYCQVVRELIKFTREFRVLALSATPGSDLKAVQQVMNNLLISHIELRSEESIDIRPYTHERKIDKIVVPLGEELSGIRLKYIQIMTYVVQRLIRSRVVYNREATKLSKFLLLKARDEFRQNPPQNLQQIQYGNIEADFAMAISLYHGFELLQLHGLRSLYNYLTGIIVGEKGYGRTRSELLRNADFNEIMEKLKDKFAGTNTHGASSDCKVVVGHPKMQKLEEIVIDHFKTFQKKGETTRVMIFSQYRDSVQEIATILNQHQPLIKVMPFIGQSSAGKTTKGYTQKEQLMVMRQFREGGYNTLVSTCVGEEGLDIGDVDLIICFDAHKSPIRLVQRMGRTGRKRQGRIVMLVTEGKEEQIYYQSLYSKKTIHKAILNGAKSLNFYPSNPRMLPSSVTPQCHKMHITLAAECTRAAETSSRKRASLSKKAGTVADAFCKQVKKIHVDECLTAEEYSEIREEFVQLSSAAKHLSRPRCVMLESPMQNDPQDTNTSPVIDFSEWMPWQNILQSTHIIGHSIQTLNLVKTSEFIELQNCIGEEENYYDLEMSRLLKDKDVETRTHHSQGQTSMHSFMTNIQDQSKAGQEDETHSAGRQRIRSKLSKSIPVVELVDNTNQRTIVIKSDSSLDGEPEMASAEECLKPKVSKLFTAVGHGRDISNTSSFHDTKKRKSQKKKADSKKTCKVSSELSALKATVPVKKKKHSEINQNATAKVRTSLLLKLLETSSCNIQSTKDSDDFVVDDMRIKKTDCLDTDSERVNCVDNGNDTVMDNVHEGNDTVMDNVHEGNDTVMDNVHEGNDTVMDNVPLNAETCMDISKTDDPEYQHLVSCAVEPCDSSPQRHDISECHTSMITSKEMQSCVSGKEGFYISRPPPVSEVSELFQCLSGKEFGEIDLEEMMEQWSGLGRESYSTAVSQQNVMTSAKKWTGLKCENTNGNSFIHEKSTSRLTDGLYELKYRKKDTSGEVDVQKDVGEFVSKINQSPTMCVTEMCLPTDERVKQNTASPLFKRAINKTILVDKHAQDSLSNASEKKVMSRNEHPSNSCRNDLEDIKCDTSFVRKCSHEIKMYKQVLSPQELKNDIFSDMNHQIFKTSVLDGEDMFTNSFINASLSPGKAHESFVTFTQAMEYLQTSSEETHEIYTLSPEAGKTNRSKVCIENPRSATKTSCGNKFCKIEMAENVQQNVEICDQYRECKIQDVSLIGKAVHCSSSSANKSPAEIPECISKPAIHESDVVNLTQQEDPQLSDNLTPPDLSIATPVIKCSSKSELPQFDLGFDFDDDDIIPPTPTKNQSQESVFGLKSLSFDKPSLQKTKTFLFNDTDEPQLARMLSSDIPVASPPASALSTDTGNFEPFDNAFDLQLSDDNQEELEELCQHDPLENTPPASDADTSKQLGRKQNHRLNYSYLEVEKDDKDRTISQIETGITFPVLPLIVESENKKSTSLKSTSPSPPKKKKIPFDEYCDISEKLDDPAINVVNSSLKEKTSSSEALPRHSVKSGRLRLGKRYVQEVAIKHDSCNIISTDKKDKKYHQLKSGELSPQTAFNLSIDLDEIDDYNTSFDQMPRLSLRSNSPFAPSGNLLGASTTPSHTEESPEVCDKSSHGELVKASTPVRGAAKGYHAGYSVAGGSKVIEDMSQLTPVRVHKEQSQCDSADDIFFRRKKFVKALDISSDAEDSTSVSTLGVSKSKMLTLKQNEASNMKETNKSLLESISNNFDDDFEDMDDFEGMEDFQVSERVTSRSEERNKKKKMPSNTRKGAVFIEKEAEVSGDAASSDEEEDVDDFYESSFIDNNTVMTQTQTTDMRAIYLKSIKSPLLTKTANYCKMQYNLKRKQENVFSQMLSEGEGLSEYEEDSFCVGSDEEDIIYTEEESQLSEHTQKRSRKAKAGKDQKGKRRIKLISDSSCDEEQNSHIQMTQEFSIHPCKFGRKVLLSSSSEDEESKGPCAILGNLKATGPDNLEKSSKISSKLQCSSDTDLDRCDVIRPGAVVEKSKGNKKLSDNHQMSSTHSDIADIGNFDLQEDTDWSDDFIIQEPNNLRSNASPGTSVKEGPKDETCKTGSRFQRAKDNTGTPNNRNDGEMMSLFVESVSCAILGNLKAAGPDNLEKSCKISSRVQCSSNTTIDRFDVIIPGAVVEKSVGDTKLSDNHQMSSTHSNIVDIGNFDLLKDTDWSDDFIIQQPNNIRSNASPGTSMKKKPKDDTCKTGSRFLSAKDNTVTPDDRNVGEVMPVLVGSVSCNKSGSEIRVQKLDSFECRASSSFTNITGKPYYDNLRNFSKKNENGSKIELQTRQLSGNKIECQTKLSPNTNILPSLLLPSSSQKVMDSTSDFSTTRSSVDVKLNTMDVNFVKPTMLMVMPREERLRKQKEKQEMYRKKLQQVQQIKSSLSSLGTNNLTDSEVIHQANPTGDYLKIPSFSSDSKKFDFGDERLYGQTSPVFTKLMEVKRTERDLQILVDSREISGAQDIISALRLKHGITVTARQLSCCDYILSNHLAVDRIQNSSFSNSSCRSKLSSKLNEMQAMYERCVLIVEADKVKPGQEKCKKSILRTKYLDMTLSYLVQSRVKVYFTDNADETATLLADLCNVEAKKGRTISVPVELSSAKEEMYKFLLSVPRVTVPQALNLAHRFRSVVELMSSPPGVIQERGCMTMDSAHALHQFLYHQFDIQMMPCSKR